MRRRCARRTNAGSPSMTSTRRSQYLPSCRARDRALDDRALTEQEPEHAIDACARRQALQPAGVVARAAGVLDGGDRVLALRLQREDREPRGRRPRGELDEHAGPPRGAHPCAQLVGVGDVVHRVGHVDAEPLPRRRARALVEQHSDRGGRLQHAHALGDRGGRDLGEHGAQAEVVLARREDAAGFLVRDALPAPRQRSRWRRPRARRGGSARARRRRPRRTSRCEGCREAAAVAARRRRAR